MEKATSEKCEWTEIDGYTWKAECGKSMHIEFGDVKSNGFVYCAFCGKRIEEKPLIEEATI